MSETNSQAENRKCKVCGKDVVETGTSGLVHVGGGAVEQKCNNPACGWSGGQAGKFSACPRCGDGTQLEDSHVAQ